MAVRNEALRLELEAPPREIERLTEELRRVLARHFPEDEARIHLHVQGGRVLVQVFLPKEGASLPKHP